MAAVADPGLVPAEPRSARTAWAAAAAAAVLVVLTKPWAVTQPQLWAEDGSVHLLDNETYGVGALLHPYRGYLHTWPRLIAWLAGRTTDVAHWPLFYSLAALLVAAGIFARLASPRLELPAKPWLILAFVLAANAGETFLNLTNLHWLTSFFLLQQVLIAPPRHRWEGAADGVLLVLAGLTGPFVVVFLPLFVWRWWRERSRYALTVLLVAAACATVQGLLVAETGPHFAPQAQPLQPAMLWHVLGLRLVAWPLLGGRLALALPAPVPALMLAAVVGGLGWAAFRPHPQRRRRLEVLAAFGLIIAACMYRLRPDTWEFLELENGDSYFYIPRVLLAWLVIWQFDARPAAVAWVIRGACVAGVLLNAGDYIKPAPPNYEWRLHCGAIRQGQAANIPILPEGWILQYPGRSVHAELGPGWYAEEFDGRKTWNWSAGRATLRIVAGESREVRLHFALRGWGARQVTARVGDTVVWRGAIDFDQREISIVLPALPMGTTEIELSSDVPGEKEASKNRRVLAFALYRLGVD